MMINNTLDPGSVASNLATLYGQHTTMDANRVVYSGTNITFDLKEADRLPEDAAMAWKGRIYNKTGLFWMPNAVSAGAVKQAIATHGKYKVAQYHTGLGDRQVSHLLACFVEIDKGTIEEQAAALDRVGIPWNLITMSGDTRPESAKLAGVAPSKIAPGKSLHAVILIEVEECTPTTLARWVEVQEALCSAVGGDESLTDPGQLMRLPGALAWDDDRTEARIQTLLMVRGGRVTLDALHTRLVKPSQEVVGSFTELDLTAPIKGEKAVKGSGKRGASIDPTTVVRLANGHEMVMQDAWQHLEAGGSTVSCFCPVHSNTRTPAATLALTPAGVPFVTCFGECAQTFYGSNFSLTAADPLMIPGSKTGTPLGSSLKKGVPSLDPGSSNDLYGVSHKSVTRYTRGDLISSRYIPARKLSERVTYIRSPKGSGKTELFRAEVSRLNAWAGARVVAVCHRRMLTRELSRRLNLPCYLDAAAGQLTGSVAVCLDSLRRVSLTHLEPIVGTPLSTPKPTRIDLLVIDEIGQVLQAITGGTMDAWESLAAFDALVQCINQASRIVVADADLDATTVNFLRFALGWEQDTAPRSEDLRVCDLAPSYSYEVTEDKREVDAVLLGAWQSGKRVAVPCFSKAEVERITKMLASTRPSAKVLTVHADAEPVDWTQPNWAQYDAVVYSPTMGTGVSVDLKGHFDAIVGYFCHGVGTAQDAHQMLHRVRHPSSSVVTCWIDPSGQPRASNPEQLHAILMGFAKVQDGRQEHPTLTRIVNGEVQAAHPGHLRLHCRVVCHRRTWGADGTPFAPAFRQYLKTLNRPATELISNATDEEIQAVKLLRAEASEVVKQEAIDRIVNAAVIPVDDARKIREPSTAELRSIQRAEIQDHYGDADQETVKRDRDGKRRAESRVWAQTKAVLEGQGDRLRIRDLKDAESGSVPHYKKRAIRAEVMAKVLKMAGLEGVVSGKAVQLDMGKVIATAVWMAKRAPFLSEMGIRVRGDARKNPVQQMGAILLQMGVKLSTKKVGAVRTYRINAASLTEIASDARRYHIRLTTSEVGIIDPVIAYEVAAALEQLIA
jgi:hypothetical protein